MACGGNCGGCTTSLQEGNESGEVDYSDEQFLRVQALNAAVALAQYEKYADYSHVVNKTITTAERLLAFLKAS